MIDLPPYPGTPRWVKVFGSLATALLVFAALVIFIGVGGPHGPARHGPSGGVGGPGMLGLLGLLGVLIVSSVALTWGWLADKGVVPSRLGRAPIGQEQRARRPMTLTPALRKLALTAHVTSSVGSLGAVAVFLALAVVGLSSQEVQVVRAAYLAMDVTARFVIVPLLFASLVIGLVQALGTSWGLVRHYWVLTKLLLTVLTIVVLLLQMEGISSMAGAAAETALSASDFRDVRISLRTHAAAGLVALLVLVVLSIYKPRGMTRHGWRKQNERPASP